MKRESKALTMTLPNNFSKTKIPNNRPGPCQASEFLNSTKFLAELEEIQVF